MVYYSPVPGSATERAEHTFWLEAAPILRHAGVVLILELSLLVFGVIAHGLVMLSPQHSSSYARIETVDILVAYIVLCMFGLYTIALVGIRLFSALRVEWYSVNSKN